MVDRVSGFHPKAKDCCGTLPKAKLAIGSLYKERCFRFGVIERWHAWKRELGQNI